MGGAHRGRSLDPHRHLQGWTVKTANRILLTEVNAWLRTNMRVAGSDHMKLRDAENTVEDIIAQLDESQYSYLYVKEQAWDIALRRFANYHG